MSPNVRMRISYLAGVLALVVLGPTLAASAKEGALRKTSSPPDSATAQRAVPGGPNFGPNDYEVVSLTAYDFEAFRSVGFVTGVDDDSNGFSWATGGTNKIFVAGVQVPAGVVIDFVGLRYCDSVGTSQFSITLFDIFADGSFNPIINNIYPDTGCTTMYNPVAAGYNWDSNAGHSLDIYLFQGGPDVAGEVKFRGAEVWYKRKVSPAPLTATFTDVPLSDFAFQFIEAFNAAGITVGCNVSPPQFCPDNNVTRREMAVFFAKALGLHFPQ